MELSTRLRAGQSRRTESSATRFWAVKPKPKAETPAKPVEPAPAPKPPPDDDELDMGDLKNPFRKK